MHAINRHRVREFDTSRKPHHWGKRKLKRDQITIWITCWVPPGLSVVLSPASDVRWFRALLGSLLCKLPKYVRHYPSLDKRWGSGHKRSVLVAVCGCISRTQKYSDSNTRNLERNRARHRSLRTFQMFSANRPATRLATRLSFLVAGFGIACWAPLVPFAKQRLAIDDGSLGCSCFASVLGRSSPCRWPAAWALGTAASRLSL